MTLEWFKRPIQVERKPTDTFVMSTNEIFSLVLRIFAIRPGATAAEVAIAVLLDGADMRDMRRGAGVGVAFSEEDGVESVLLFGECVDVLMAAAALEAAGMLDRPRVAA